jgi:hypothetical protein
MYMCNLNWKKSARDDIEYIVIEEINMTSSKHKCQLKIKFTFRNEMY